MKIAVIGHLKHPIRKPFAGGLESFTHGYVRSLQCRGHRVVLFASGDSDSELPLCPTVERATVPDSVARFGRCHDSWIDSVEDAAYSKLMDRLVGCDFDVIHNHSLSPIPLAEASKQRCPLVTTLHAPRLPRMADILRRQIPGTCGYFVNVSKSNSNNWRHVIPRQKIIHNGVDTRSWNCGRSDKRPRAVWFGRVLPDKGTHHAVAAAHRAGLSIDVVGPISDSSYFQRQVAPRLSPMDRYLGHQPQERLRAIISSAAVAVITPCWDEPFGLVIVEALACGTPIAGFARGALPEIVRPSVGRLARSGDVDALAAAIRHASSLSPDVCRRYVQEHFSLERMISRYEGLYEQCIQTGKPGLLSRMSTGHSRRTLPQSSIATRIPRGRATLMNRPPIE